MSPFFHTAILPASIAAMKTQFFTKSNSTFSIMLHASFLWYMIAYILSITMITMQTVSQISDRLGIITKADVK